MQRFCFAIDLIDDADKIAEYEMHHVSIWPEIENTFYRDGVSNVELYRTGNRLFMILEVNDDFSLEKKQQSDIQNPTVQKWEALMSGYQQPLSWAEAGQKWTKMNCVYKLK